MNVVKIQKPNPSPGKPAKPPLATIKESGQEQKPPAGKPADKPA
jgi:hypothetical protein